MTRLHTVRPVGWQNDDVKRSGVADLPLHGGRVPPWLADADDDARHRHRRERPPSLRPPGAAVAAERSVLVPGPRLGDGHGLALLRHHHVGDGRAEARTQPARARARHLHLRRTRPAVAQYAATNCATSPTAIGLDGDALVRTSRLTARIDNNAIDDGFQIYLHTFVLTPDGDWAVVQQGMNEASRLARRYHWHSAAVRDFTADPHTAIVGEPAGIDHETWSMDGPGRRRRRC